MLTMRASRPSGERCCRSGRSRAARLSWKRLRSGELAAAADFLPRSGQRRQKRDGAHRHGAALAALHAVIQADGGGPRGGVLARQLDDVSRRDAGERGHALGRISFSALAQCVETRGVARDVIGVVEIFADDDVHQAERQRDVAAGVDEEMPVGELRRCGCGADRWCRTARRCAAPPR